jgi:FkbM family methyltransferase
MPRMHLKSRLKDWRRRRQLARAGIGVELAVPTFTAGARSGVWVVASDGLGKDSVVWSFGVGDNIAWELAMIAQFGCAVHAFDPTPRAIAWLRAQTTPAAFRFHALGLGDRDGDQPFAPPRSASDVNFRPTAQPVAGDITAPVRRLSTLARQLGTAAIDVLKLDIEGGEYGVLADVLAHGPRPRQLLVEFHHGQHGVPFAATADALAALRGAGYRLFAISRRGLEMSLLAPAR